jgi:hypothetical protein
MKTTTIDLSVHIITVCSAELGEVFANDMLHVAPVAHDRHDASRRKGALPLN